MLPFAPDCHSRKSSARNVQGALVSSEKFLGAKGTPPAQELSNLTFVHTHFENSADVPVAFRNKCLLTGKSLQKGVLRSSELESPLPKAISCCLGRQGAAICCYLASWLSWWRGGGRKEAPSWQRNLTPRPTVPLAASTHRTGWGMMPYAFSSLSNRSGYSEADTWEKAECSSLQQQWSTGG